MSIAQITQSSPGLEGVEPRLVHILTDDSFATITTAGWLSEAQREGLYSPLPSDMLLISYNSFTSPIVGTFAISISGNVVTLNPASGDVILPVTSGNFANFIGVTGNISDQGYLPSNAAKTKVVMAGSAVQTNYIAHFVDVNGTIDDTAGTIQNDGPIQSGKSGLVGGFIAYPPGAANGFLELLPINAGGAFNTIISNSTMGQTSTISIPDPGGATAKFVLSALSGAGIQHITTGSLEVDTGNLIAGSSGSAGDVQSFPPTAGNGELILAAVNAGGAFNTTISNASSVGQSQVISIPDSGAATANFVLSKTLAGTQTLSGSLSFVGGGSNIQTTGGGNFLGGSSGAAGFFVSYPPAAASGRLIFEAINSGNFDVTINNGIYGQASVLTIPDVGGATSNFVMSSRSTGTQNIAGNLTLNSNPVAVTKVVTATSAALATAGKVNVFVPSTVTAQIAILDIKVFLSTGLSGGGGDRLLSLADGSLVFNSTGITAALLGTPIFTLWGSAGNPITGAAEQSISTAGATVYLQYISGTADYAAGSVIIAVTYAQVTT